MALLLEYGAELVAAFGHSGMAPLHLAARAGALEIAKMLLAAKADPNAVDAKGKTALQLAEVNKKEAVVALLSEVQ